ncbi:MAG TPA: hypothetical protein VN761_00725 [Candidatus Polarisedimenticolia bacterium]|nr:hypothetical protein [Candidatus Polarisedimenticolia bacterium]
MWVKRSHEELEQTKRRLVPSEERLTACRGFFFQGQCLGFHASFSRGERGLFAQSEGKLSERIVSQNASAVDTLNTFMK